MKTRILFVDDEPGALSTLRHRLQAMDVAWEMAFVADPREGLARLTEDAPFDVVVAAMHLSGLSGADVLREAQARCPGSIRIVLSGPADRDRLLQTVRPAHQCLAKPCQPAALQAAIDRGLALREVFLDERVKNVVARIDQLPTVPRLYAALLDELARPEPSVRTVAELVSRDVAMAAGLLKLVNSAYFGLRMPVSSPAHAVQLLGLAVIKALVLSVGLFGRFDTGVVPHFDLEQLWRHCLSTGRLAREIAALEDADGPLREQCFIAGLLHDVGKLVMAANFPEDYATVVAGCRQGQGTVLDMEQLVFGASHAEVGAYLLGLWGVDDAVVRAVYLHHEPGRARQAGFSALAAVHVANRLEHELVVVNGDYAVNPLDELYLAASGLSARVLAWRAACAVVVEEETGGNPF